MEPRERGSQHGSVDWLSAIIDDGRLLDVDDESEINVARGVPSDVIAKYDGALAGAARISNIDVVAFAQESSYKGGSMGLEQTRRLRKSVATAMAKRIPLIGLYESGGARVQDGGRSLDEISALIGSLMKAREVVPVISAVMGTVSGGASYAAATGHALILIRGRSRMFIWGPGIAKAEMGLDVSVEQLGGVAVHVSNGFPSHIVESASECLQLVKRIVISLGPSTSRLVVTRVNQAAAAAGEGTRTEMTARDLISRTFDEDSFLEFRSFFSGNLITGFARLAGRPVGIIASNGTGQGRFLDVDSCRKMTLLAGVCNSLNLPLVTLLDSPGVSPTPEQMNAGLVPASEDAIKEYASDACPKVTVVTGEAYGVAFVGFASKALGSRRKVFAFPNAKISVMSLPSYMEIFHRKKLEGLQETERKKIMDSIETDFKRQMDPSLGVGVRYIDEIIKPSEVRTKLLSAFASLTESGSRVGSDRIDGTG